MTQNLDALSKLSDEKQAVLSDELKAAFCMLSEADQKFFAEHTSTAKLPAALTKKMELMQSRKDNEERFANLLESIRSAPPAASSTSAFSGEDIVTGVAGALGLGAAAVMTATDNSAYYTGVQPKDLLPALRAEFNTGKTAIQTEGKADQMTVIILMNPESEEPTPALTINLTSIRDGIEIKVNDLTAAGFLEALTSGGGKLFSLAGKGLQLFSQGKRGADAEELLETASETLDAGKSLAKEAAQLKLKERAWKAMRPAAEAIEAQALDIKQVARDRQAKIEQEWQNYTNCPNCSVAFGDGDTECRVCEAARPERPKDPR